jgi:hypothetical protein
MSTARGAADQAHMDRRVIWLFAAAGSIVGSFVPALWGASEMSLSSILFSLIGGVAGVVVGARVAGV